jgi:glucuronokinase
VDQADDDRPIVEQVQARAALAGNPSDGYAGGVFAIPVDAYGATVTLRAAGHFSISDDISGHRTFARLDELREAGMDLRAHDPHALVLATVAHFLQRTNADVRPCEIEVSSSIPVSIGLAGSSAIVIGVLRALHKSTQHPLPRYLPLASMALDVETRWLGITAGMQDRLVQVYGRPVLMRFDPPGDFGVKPAPGEDRGNAAIVEPGADFRFLVAHRRGSSEPSQIVHGNLRRRFDAGDQTVQAGMRQLLAHAISAGNAFAAGNAEWLGESMDATYDLRSSMIDLAPGHVKMVEAARSAGASANYTGSGGAIVALSSSDEIESATRQSLKRLGCEVVSVDAGPDAPLPTRSPPAPLSD